jgi:hypothetical protein
MLKTLYLATDRGVLGFECDGQKRTEVSRGLIGKKITSVSCWKAEIVAGTPDGIYRSDDSGQTWEIVNSGLSVPHIRWLAHHPDSSGLVFAGTEPAAIFRSHDGGQTWQECPEVAQLRDRFGWYLPYSPEAGCVRGFASHGSHVYAAVEQGGLLRSEDRGMSWQLVEGSNGEPRAQPDGNVHPDVHSVNILPLSSDTVFASTGGGFYRSDNAGKTWTCLYRCYCRAAWIDPTSPDHYVLGPADWVDRNGRIEESMDGGLSWRPASGDLQAPWPGHMVERFLAAGDELLAVRSNGHLLAADFSTLAWQRILPEVEGVLAVANAPF